MTLACVFGGEDASMKTAESSPSDSVSRGGNLSTSGAGLGDKEPGRSASAADASLFSSTCRGLATSGAERRLLIGCEHNKAFFLLPSLRWWLCDEAGH